MHEVSVDDKKNDLLVLCFIGFGVGGFCANLPGAVLGVATVLIIYKFF